MLPSPGLEERRNFHRRRDSRRAAAPMCTAEERRIAFRAVHSPDPLGGFAGENKSRCNVGNPAPRIFRLIEQEGIINRLGFNNKGVDYLIERLKNKRYQGILGINIGKNAKTALENAIDDYKICMSKIYQYANYNRVLHLSYQV